VFDAWIIPAVHRIGGSSLALIEVALAENPMHLDGYMD
jgi:hypothetical protein